MDDVDSAADALATGNQEKYETAMAEINKKIESMAKLTQEDMRLRPENYV